MFSVHLNPFQNNFTKKTFISAAFKLRLSKKRRTLDSQNGLVLKYCNWGREKFDATINVIEIEGLLFLGFGPMCALHGKLVFPIK